MVQDLLHQQYEVVIGVVPPSSCVFGWVGGLAIAHFINFRSGMT